MALTHTYRCAIRPSVVRDFVPGGDEDPGGREVGESHEGPSHVVCCPPQDRAVRRLSVWRNNICNMLITVYTWIAAFLCVTCYLDLVYGD